MARPAADASLLKASYGPAVGGKGSNAVQLRHYNERVVLEAIRRAGEASKADVGRYAKLTPPAIAAIIDALVSGGYLVESGKRPGAKGQPSTLYRLAPDGAYSAGLHIGRRSLDAILTGFSGETIAFETHDYDYPSPDVVRRLARNALARFRRKLGQSASRLVGIGVSAPYFIGGWFEELGFPLEASTAWKSMDLRRELVEISGLAVFVENDASAAAVAELVHGVGTHVADFLHISLNTFVGAGLVLEGTLQTGPNGNTAAFGPFPVTPSQLNSVLKPAGKFDVLLHRASVYVLLEHLRANGFPISRARELARLPPEAAALVADWQADCADALAQAIIGAIAIVDVDAVIIDGLLPEAILTPTVACVRRAFAEMLPPGLVVPTILQGKIGRRASALGASFLPIHSIFGPDTGVLTKRGSEKKPLMVGQSA